MELESMFRWIEDLDADKHSDLWITIGLQSTTSCVVHRLEEHPDVKTLIELTKDSSENRGELIGHAVALWQAYSDPKFAHPNDNFLVPYIYVMSMISDNLESGCWKFVELVGRSCNPQFFTSVRVATYLYNRKHSAEEIKEEQHG